MGQQIKTCLQARQAWKELECYLTELLNSYKGGRGLTTIARMEPLDKLPVLVGEGRAGENPHSCISVKREEECCDCCDVSNCGNT